MKDVNGVIEDIGDSERKRVLRGGEKEGKVKRGDDIVRIATRGFGRGLARLICRDGGSGRVEVVKGRLVCYECTWKKSRTSGLRVGQ